MKRKIAILAGGNSLEHDVSLRSAQGIYSFMNKDKYDCFVIEIKGQEWHVQTEGDAVIPVDKSDLSFEWNGERIRPDFCYITIHGNPGENGELQGYLNLIGIPYSTGDVLVEALTYNKYFLNNFLRAFDVQVADSIQIRAGQEDSWTDEAIINRLGLPCFVKPSADGSSFGVTKVCKVEQLRPAIKLAMSHAKEIMIERFMQGREITCGCYLTKTGGRTFPITEVVSHNDFFDYDAKYNGAVEEITPARISPVTAERVSQLTQRIYTILDCEGIARIDYILMGEDENEEIHLLEVNTTPGMTATSFIPQQVRAAGLEMSDILSEIIENKF